MRVWRVVYARLARPQTAVVVLAALVLAAAYMMVPKIVRPVQAVTTPVIQPIEQRVQSAAISAPVDCAKVACLALTFDDGPDAAVTPRVLDILDRHNAKATIFLVGVRIPGNEALVRRIHASGHEIGNHTWSHRKLSDLTPQEVEEDVSRAQNAIAATGVPAPKLLRPPYGALSPMVRSHIPLTIVSWNIDPEDWKALDAAQITAHVLAHAKPGAIVDLHDIYHTTADALDPLLTGLEQNYHLVTVSDLLDLPSGQPGIFYGR